MFFNETQRHEIRDPPQPSLLREGANIAETGMISICDSNNSLPKQGGRGWVSFLTLHRKMLISKWLHKNVKSCAERKTLL